MTRFAIIIPALALVLAGGCTQPDSAFTGSPHGYIGTYSGTWFDLRGAPSIIQDGEAPLHSDYGADGSMADMPGTFTADAAGNINATGVPAYWLAKGAFCRAAPQAPDCGPSVTENLTR